ncbi:FmdB family zinc ribbon protein [Nocardioides sp. KR10-350]|uniref:FmdB family zinc ribbon protein n=1 Tax=Nocardioides cheoyonin TaxID=3156615 RepID=UPI0032B5D236
MPTYQYACTECGHAFEQFQSFTEDSLTVCPECNGRLRKVFSAAGVVFKGSGFYRTDSRSSSNGSSGSNGSGSAGSSSSSDSSSSSSSSTTTASAGSSTD